VSAPLLCVVIEGNPGDGAVNRAYGTGRGQFHKTAQAKAFARRASKAVRLAIAGPLPGEVFSVVVISYWPRRRHLAEGLAMGDVDSPLKAVLDALEAGGAFDDDTRVVEVIARKAYDKERPRIEVSVWPAKITVDARAVLD